MQVRKQQLELDMEQQTGSKSEKEYVKAERASPEKAMAPHSSTLAWKIPGTEEPSGLTSMGLHRVRHD